MENVNTSEPVWLAKIREDSKKHFDELPLEKSQYIKLDIDFDKILKQRNGQDEEIAPQMPSSVSKLLDDKSRIMIAQLNNKIVKVNLPESLKKKGVVLCSFRDALASHSALVEDFFRNRTIRIDESKLVAFNYANFNSGVFLYIPKNVDVENPIYHIMSIDGSATIAQTVIIAEEGSRLTFVEEDYSTGKEAFHSSLVEIHLAENASANFVNIQDFSENVTSIVNKKAMVEKDARMNWIIGLLGSRLSRAKRDTILAGQGSSVGDTEVFFGRNAQHFDITSNISHTVPNTKGEVLVKGVLCDKARSVSQGMIRVDKNAQKTDSFLAEHTMLLDKETRSDAVPGLEIEANDVRCTHSASVSQIDEEQVFYLVSKGLTESEARKLIVLGFLDSAFQRIQVSDINERFKALIEEKWG